MSLAHRNEMRYWNVKRKFNCTKYPFTLSIDEWRRCWMNSPYRDLTGHIARIDNSKPWTASNIQYLPTKCRRERASGITAKPSLDTTRTLTVGEWARELSANR